MTERRHFCWFCGKDMGPWTRFCEATDTCGEKECERAAREAAAAERDQAHENLDRERGWR